MPKADAVEPAKKKKRKKKKKKRMSKGWTTFFTVILVLFMVCVVAAGSIAFSVFYDVGLIGHINPDKEVAGIDYIDLNEYISNQQQTTIVYAYDSNNNEKEIARLHGTENRIWIELDDISDYVKEGFIALEDKRFYQHKGVDWIRTAGSVVYDIMGKDLQGGSTITQQLIKNLTGENKKTLVRKYNEIKNALALERHYSKDEILEAYLNTIYLDMGCYGIKTGAEYYFGKEAKDLTLMESVTLVVITNAPRTYNPILNYENNLERAKICLWYMLDQGKITQEQYDAALAEKLTFVGKLEDDDSDEDETVTETEYQSYYIDFIIDEVMDDLSEKYGFSETEAWRKVFYGGLKIYAAVDLDIQEQMEDVYYNRVTFPKEEDTETHPAIQSAMTVMNYEGRVLGIVGQLGPKPGNRVLNMAADSPRNPGSSIKPLSAYAPAIDLDAYYWSSYLPNYGIQLAGMDKAWPTNYGGVTGSMSDLRNLQEALAPSLNTIPARIINTITVDKGYSYLRDNFHISTLVPEDAAYAPLAIGDMAYGVTTLDMAAAYATFGNGGKYYEPWCYYKVTNSSGETVLLETENEPTQAISEGTSTVMNHMLQTVVTASNGTANGYGVSGFTTFAKTGTSSSNKDKWMCGGTPYYVAAAWVGFKDNREININVYGTYPAARVWKEVMNRIHKNLDTSKEFEDSEQAVKRTYCTRTGLLASSSCYSTKTGWYKIDNLPGTCRQCSGGYSYEDDDTEAQTDSEENYSVEEEIITSAEEEQPATEPPTEAETAAPAEVETEAPQE